MTPLPPPLIESELFIASNITSLEDFLKTELSVGKHVYCCFSTLEVNPLHYKDFKHRQLRSISFQNGYTLYPPFQYP